MHMHNYSMKDILGDFNADLLSNSPDANFIRSVSFDSAVSYLIYADDLQLYIQFLLSELDCCAAIMRRQAKHVSR